MTHTVTYGRVPFASHLDRFVLFSWQDSHSHTLSTICLYSSTFICNPTIWCHWEEDMFPFSTRWMTLHITSLLNNDYLRPRIQDWKQISPRRQRESDGVPRCMACPWAAVGRRNKASWPRYTPSGVCEHAINPTKCIRTACGSTPSIQLSKSTDGPFPQRPSDFKTKTSTSVSTSVWMGGTMTDVPPLWRYFFVLESLIRSGLLPLGPLYVHAYYRTRTKKEKAPSHTFIRENKALYTFADYSSRNQWETGSTCGRMLAMLLTHHTWKHHRRFQRHCTDQHTGVLQNRSLVETHNNVTRRQEVITLIP